MRRFLCFWISVMLLAMPAALAEQTYMDTMLDAIDALRRDGLTQDVSFHEWEPWMSSVVVQRGEVAPQFDGRQWIGLVFDKETGERVTWDDLFVDGDAAAAQMETIAEASTYDNAYAEHNQIVPMPRDSFAIAGNTLTVFYPADQLSHFTGRSGAFSFYAYELDGLLGDGVPLTIGDVSQAAEALQVVLSTGTLLDCTLGGSMAEAAETLDVVDVPDLTYDSAVYRFEAPQMRGAALLSAPDDDRIHTATITGVCTERIDFSGLCTGIATRAQCVDALGEPDTIATVDTADAYSRLPIGETLGWHGEGRALELHFVDDVLQSVTLRVL